MDLISRLWGKDQHRYNKLMTMRECKCSPECLRQTKTIRLMKALKPRRGVTFICL